jgi:TM2 domain-containing membrane protein YozV
LVLSIRFGSYRVFTFQLGLTIQLKNGRLTAAGDCVSKKPANKIARGVVWILSAGVKTMRDPFTAGLLSFIIPGVGQLYNGRILAGILWLIITPGFWIGTGGTLGWVCHIIAAYTAYSYAKDHPVRLSALV